MSELVPVVQMVGAGVVEIYGELDQPEPQNSGIEIDILLRIARDRRDVVNPENLLGGFHPQSLSRREMG